MSNFLCSSEFHVNPPCLIENEFNERKQHNAHLFSSFENQLLPQLWKLYEGRQTIEKAVKLALDIGEFLQEFKNADIIPAHKKKEKSEKTNYRPVSILPNLSNIYEKLFYNQLYDYFDKILIFMERWPSG